MFRDTSTKRAEVLREKALRGQMLKETGTKRAEVLRETSTKRAEVLRETSTKRAGVEGDEH